MIQVLLVEDDQLLARQFITVLEAQGYSVKHARHAAEAIQHVDIAMPDIIILDLLLPVTTGIALLHELQSYEDTQGVPIVVCTSMADSIRLEELQPYGVQRLIDKTTMQPSDLGAAVRALV